MQSLNESNRSTYSAMEYVIISRHSGRKMNKTRSQLGIVNPVDVGADRGGTYRTVNNLFLLEDLISSSHRLIFVKIPTSKLTLKSEQGNRQVSNPP